MDSRAWGIGGNYCLLGLATPPPHCLSFLKYETEAEGGLKNASKGLEEGLAHGQGSVGMCSNRTMVVLVTVSLLRDWGS